ncbi:class I adenylate-forming enzyme family protein [Pseudoruegeria sp. HB172150]|uniref:class I adenylate-forming enzyme family protein n=1 Tax=Pseudoruegeria sp. HB172150 TaxID=2721164 RepID=UPI0015554CBC|nr:class I adenylate-forming enzyme family protein [Pseudoruegeria sp. HB172150]
MHDDPTPGALIRAATDLTLADVLRTQATIRPDAEALVMGESSLTYRELNDITDRLATGLRQTGMRRGDRLAVLSHNSIRYVLLFHAAAKAGIAIAALNWRFAPAELEHAISVVEPAYIAVSEECGTLLDRARVEIPRILMDRYETGGSTLSFGDLSNTSPERFEIQSEDIVSITFTSGSTGHPKAVAISHRALLARAAVIGIDWLLEPGDAFVGWAPLFHIAASDYVFTTMVMSGTYVVVDGFRAEVIADTARARKIGWLFLVPGTVEPLIEALGSAPLPGGQMKLVGVMADLIPPAEMQRICAVTGARYLNSYGMTESGLIPCVPSVTESSEGIGQTLPKMQSAMCSIRLIDEAGQDVPDGEPGQLLIRSQTLASGYWNNSEATAKAFAGGWYHSGDVLRRNADGTLQFVGRVSGMIKSGGENIYPAEIERALLAHADVTEAAAIGVTHPKWGETPVAFVSLSDGAICGPDALKQHLRGHIAGYKIPSEIHIIALSDFARNVTGKIDRLALRKLLQLCGT